MSNLYRVKLRRMTIATKHHVIHMTDLHNAICLARAYAADRGAVKVMGVYSFQTERRELSRVEYYDVDQYMWLTVSTRMRQEVEEIEDREAQSLAK